MGGTACTAPRDPSSPHFCRPEGKAHFSDVLGLEEDTGRLSAVDPGYVDIDASEIGANSYRKTKQNLALGFLFNSVGVPLASTGGVDPLRAMIAMATSVSAVQLNSFTPIRSVNSLRSFGGRFFSTREEVEEPTRLAFTILNMHCEHCARTISKGPIADVVWMEDCAPCKWGAGDVK